ncbi:hypothetical protein MTO96_018754 [Rhipicephalus appendiculatus]
METEQQLLNRGRSPVDDAGKGHGRCWNILSLVVLAVVLIVLLSMLFAFVVSMGAPDEADTTVDKFPSLSLRVPESFDDQGNAGVARASVADYITRTPTC